MPSEDLQVRDPSFKDCFVDIDTRDLCSVLGVVSHDVLDAQDSPPPVIGQVRADTVDVLPGYGVLLGDRP